jgi:hypothetical protein
VASSLYRKQPQRIRARWLVLPVCWLVYAALEERSRTARQELAATCPDHKGQRRQPPTAGWVGHDVVGIQGLYIPGQGLLMLKLPDEHQHRLQRLGKR